jgi:hypothetical protein
MKNEQYIIDDLEEFTLSARRLVFNGFGKGLADDPDEFLGLMNEQSAELAEEMDEVLNQKESLIIVKNLAIEQKNKYKDISRFIIDEKIFSKIIEALNTRLVSNLLASLSAKGMIESAYDEKLNDFVFWVNDNEDDETRVNKNEDGQEQSEAD